MTKKEVAKFVVQTLIYLLTALASAMGVSSCVNHARSQQKARAALMQQQTAGNCDHAHRCTACGHAHRCTACGHAHHCTACGDRHGKKPPEGQFARLQAVV